MKSKKFFYHRNVNFECFISKAVQKYNGVVHDQWGYRNMWLTFCENQVCEENFKFDKIRH